MNKCEETAKAKKVKKNHKFLHKNILGLRIVHRKEKSLSRLGSQKYLDVRVKVVHSLTYIYRRKEHHIEE